MAAKSKRMAERPDMAVVLAMIKAQQRQNELIMQRILGTKGDKNEPVDLVEEGSAQAPAEDDASPKKRRCSPRLLERAKKARAIKSEPQDGKADGTPLRRELSFEEAYDGSGKKRRRGKSPQMKLLRKKLAAKLYAFESDFMEGDLWDSDNGGLQLGYVLHVSFCMFVCLHVCFCLHVCLFVIHPLLFFFVVVYLQGFSRRVRTNN